MDLQNSHVMVDGQFVSAAIERVVLAIKEYEPTLEVKWIPPAQRTEGMAAFAIIHDAPGNKPYVLFYVPTEEEFDERVLKKIIANDQRINPQGFSELEAWEQTHKLIERQKYLDKIEEANDIAAHVLRSPLHEYKVTKNHKIRS